jgi:formylglycine-generating enzyme required for sulfatase activity
MIYWWIPRICLAWPVAFAAFAQAQAPGTVFRDCPDCPEVVVMPPGSFMMGSPASEAARGTGEGPQRTVTIAYSFAVGRYEITREQYTQFAREAGQTLGGGNCWYWSGEDVRHKSDDPSRGWHNAGYVQGNDHPVVCVNWHDAKAFTAWLSDKTGKTYRLLTEAEWEYAARAGSNTPHPWGDDSNDACINANVGDLARDRIVPMGDRRKWAVDDVKHLTTHRCDDGHGYTAPVGRFKANRFGLHDMIGNVWEWTEDCQTDSYAGAPSDGSAQSSGNCTRRMVRGGSWLSNPLPARSAMRRWDSSRNRDDNIGLRVARDL